MYFKAEQQENGEYIRHDGVRFALLKARRVRPADGWSDFDTLDDCLEAWGLIYNPSCSPEQT